MFRGMKLSVICLMIMIISCGSGSVMLKKPEPEVLVQNREVSVNTPFARLDYARSKGFNDKLRKINRIGIKYNLSSDSKFNEAEVRTSDWHKEIEKALIRMGMVINDERERAEFILNEDESEEIKSDGYVVVDKIVLKKISSEESITLDEGLERITYPYCYYIAEINGKIVLQNNDIIWTCNAVSTSFDILRIKRIKPRIGARGVRDYRYSVKLKRWVRDKWSIDTEDNFSSCYSGPIKEEFHKRELIRLAISKLFSTIMK